MGDRHAPAAVSETRSPASDALRALAAPLGLRVDGVRPDTIARLGGLVLLGLLFGAYLGAWPLFDPDEGRNAEVAREMLVGGDWTVPHFNGLPYLDKPVLFFWLVAAAFRVLGVGEVAARLPAALAAIATVVFTAALGTRLIGRSRALVAAGVVATTPMMLVFGRLAIFDVPLTAFITAALYCLVRARLDGAPMRWWPAAGLAMGLAVLTKGPVGVAVPLLAWAAARGALPRPAGRAGVVPLVLALLAGALPVVPWLVAAATREPDFLRYALVDETALRFLSPARFHRAGPVYFYATVLPWALGVWTVVLAASAGPLVRLWREGAPEAAAVGFAARAAAIIVLFFSLSASKRAQYVLPALMPLALLAAIGIAAAPARIATAMAAAGRSALLAGVVAFALAVAAPHVEGPEFFVLTPRVFTASGLVLVVWGALVAATSARRPLAAVVCAACFAPGLGLALLGPLTPYAEARSARALASHIDPAARVVAFQTFEPGLALYLGHPVLLLSDTGQELTSNYVRSAHARLGRSATLRPVAALHALLRDPTPLYLVAAPARLRELRRLGRRRFVPLYVDRRSVLLAAHRVDANPVGDTGARRPAGAS